MAFTTGFAGRDGFDGRTTGFDAGFLARVRARAERTASRDAFAEERARRTWGLGAFARALGFRFRAFNPASLSRTLPVAAKHLHARCNRVTL